MILKLARIALFLSVTAEALPAFQVNANDTLFPDLDRSGASLIEKEEWSKAEELYRGALEQARQKGDRPWTAEFLRRIGEVHQHTQDLKGALARYEEALPIRQEVGPESKTAELLLGTGWIRLRLGMTGAAERIEQGRALYHSLGDLENEANARILLAQIATNMEKADEQFQALLALYAERHMPAGTVSVRASRAAMLFNRAMYRDALAEGFTAVDTANALLEGMPNGEARNNLLTNKANAMETVGNAYQKMMQPARALDYYNQALRIRQDLHDGEKAASVATNMGPLLIRQGKMSEAVSALEQALAIRRGLGNAANTAATLSALAEANLAQGKTREAQAQYDEALSLSPAGSPAAAVALYQLGNIFLEAGRLDDALNYHQRALALRTGTRNLHDHVRSLIQIANVRERRGELAEAEAAQVQAVNGFEKLSLQIADPVQFAAFRETAARLYPSYARVLFKQGKTSEALLMAERGRGQALSRMYGTHRASFPDMLTPEERAKWSEATGALAKAANHFRMTIEQHAPETQRSEANAAWLEAKMALSRTRERIFSQNPSLQNQEAPQQPATADLLALSRRNPRTIYLEWTVVDNSSTLLFSMAGGEAKGYLLPVGTSKLSHMVSDWRVALVLADGRGVRLNAPAGASAGAESVCARALYRAAMGPTAQQLESGNWDRLVAASDGPLLDAPLAALLMDNGKRLVESFAISSAVSMHSLAQETERRAAASQLLVVGDPSIPGQERAVPPSGAYFGPLQHAAAEASAIAELFPGTTNLSGVNAKEKDVKQLLACCSILHFATHGVLDAEDGMDSGLLLAAEPENSTEDGVLQAWEIAGMRLNAKLAVLSACDTARGDRRLGEGLMGLAWAFQAAGTPAVVASVWNVDDAATARLMRAFYTELGKGSRADEALRQAMLATRKESRNQAPFYWAAFSLIGQSDGIR